MPIRFVALYEDVDMRKEAGSSNKPLTGLRPCSALRNLCLGVGAIALFPNGPGAAHPSPFARSPQSHSPTL